jgi:hypothetical protein
MAAAKPGTRHSPMLLAYSETPMQKSQRDDARYDDDGRGIVAGPMTDFWGAGRKRKPPEDRGLKTHLPAVRMQVCLIWRPGDAS